MQVDLEIGFRFLPPDEEIISFFLLNKMMGYHDRTAHIREIELLRHEPRDLPALSIVKSRYREWLFFYKLNRNSEGKAERITKAGYWKSTGQDRAVKEGGSQIGSKKTLVFYEGRTPRGVKTEWVMHEYHAARAFVPSNAEDNYVVGLLRDKAAENAETSTSNGGQWGTHFPGSTSGSIAVGVPRTGAAPQVPQSISIDYQLALQTQMEDEGIFEHDLSPSSGATNNDMMAIEEDLLPSNGFFRYDFEEDEEGVSLEELEDLPSSDGFVRYDSEEDELHLQFNDNTVEKEMDFMLSMFPDRDEHSYEETGFSLPPNRRAPAYAEHNASMSGRTGHGHSEGFNQNRMENSFRCDEILVMDGSVDSATITSHQSNCLEAFRGEKSANSRTCKSQQEPKSHKSVVQGRPKRVQSQVKSSGKSECRDKTRESGVRGTVVELVQNKKSIVQSKKDPTMDRDRNTKWVSKSRSDGSVASSRKNTFNFVEKSQLSCRPKPPLVHVANVLLGLILVIFVVREVMFLH